MANIQGTAGRDIVTVADGDWFVGNEGDDVITLLSSGAGDGCAGNDTLIGTPDAIWSTAAYWESPSAIYVDLEQGYALDGFGTRDTLVNIHNVHGFKMNGDQGYGSATSDYFWIGAWQNKPGRIFIDGRSGSDLVTFSTSSLHDSGGPLQFLGSADGRSIKVTHSLVPGFLYELHSIETINLWDNDTSTFSTFSNISLIDLSRAGEELLLRGNTGWQTAGVGKPVTVTYSFLTSTPSTGAQGGSGFSAMSASQQQVVRDIFSKLQLQTGVVFEEKTGASGQIRFGINEQSNTRGYAYSPDEFRSDEKGGDVWLDVQTATVMAVGQEGYYVLLHEIGHALGLRHPLPESDSSGATVLLNRFSYFANTVMIDVASGSSETAWPTWYGSFDLQALRSVYGTKPFSTGNDVYQFDDASGLAVRPLVDDGGIDTIDVSASSVSAYIDLQPNRACSIGINIDGKSAWNNLSIATGTSIENIIGTWTDDALYGNDLANLLKGNGGNDTLDGRAGLDQVVFNLKKTDIMLTKGVGDNEWFVDAKDGRSGSAQLLNIERVVLTDCTIALDTNGTAGQAYRIYQAAFNRAPDVTGLGYWISVMDSGATLTSIAQGFIDSPEFKTLYGTNATNAQIVSKMYDNVLHRTPDQAGYDFWVGVLDRGDASVAAVLATISESPENQAALVGVIGNGFVFTPYGG